MYICMFYAVCIVLYVHVCTYINTYVYMFVCTYIHLCIQLRILMAYLCRMHLRYILLLCMDTPCTYKRMYALCKYSTCHMCMNTVYEASILDFSSSICIHACFYVCTECTHLYVQYMLKKDSVTHALLGMALLWR